VTAWQNKNDFKYLIGGDGARDNISIGGTITISNSISSSDSNSDCNSIILKIPKWQQSTGSDKAVTTTQQQQ